jgi:hypothetical protein
MDPLSYAGAKLRINSAFTNFSQTITKGTVTIL